MRNEVSNLFLIAVFHFGFQLLKVLGLQPEKNKNIRLSLEMAIKLQYLFMLGIRFTTPIIKTNIKELETFLFGNVSFEDGFFYLAFRSK
jgi:hypothetical protein